MSQIKLTCEDVRSARRGLDRIAGMPVPVPVSMKISRLMRALDGPGRDIEKERLKLVDEHGERDADNKLIHQGVTPEGQPIAKMKVQRKFDEAFQVVLDNEITLRDVELVEPKDLQHRRKCPNCDEESEVNEVPSIVMYELAPLLLIVKKTGNDRPKKKGPKKKKGGE